MSPQKEKPAPGGESRAQAETKEKTYEPLKNSPARPAAQASRRALADWLFHARPGDLAQVIFAPLPAARAHFGRPLGPRDADFLRLLLAGGDLTIVKDGAGFVAIIDGVTFAQAWGGV